MRPNFLIFVVDEQRYSPIYETPALQQWKKQNLHFAQEMIDHGIVFHNHFTNTTACAPSRTTFHTGHYPNTHGVTQTDGLALDATDPEMTWLKEFTVPTIGNYFQQAGYRTFLKGKWHVTDASIRLGNGETLMTFNQDGDRLPEREQFYLEKNVLHNFGYDGWIGPEPHGTLPQNSAGAVPPPERGRDVGYRDQVIEELDRLKDCRDPWLMMASFVNPHDITLFGLYTENNPNYDFPIDPTLPEDLFTPEFLKSFTDDLEQKPSTQKYYRDHYPQFVQPILDLNRYYRAYYTMQKQVDQNLMQVWRAFQKSPDYRKTIVLVFSDHGDLLSAHGNMHQKWFNAYQESIKVPLIIRSPLLGDRPERVHQLTSHVDLLPTLLGLAGLDTEQLRRQLGKKFSLNLPLPGRDLSPYLRGKKKQMKSQPVYFYTEDNPTKGPHNTNALGNPYPPVPEPASVEAVIVHYKKTHWKLTRYYSTDPTYRPRPGTLLNELYNLDQDPMELTNLYGTPEHVRIQAKLTKVLNKQSFLHR